MRVLMIEDEWRAATEAQSRLRAAGHEVVRCHRDDAPAFPCDGMPGGEGCPIDRNPVDVAVSVRSQGGEVTAAEDGVRCALRHHIPVVATGKVSGAPWLGMATAVEPDGTSLVGAVERAATAPLRRHSELASTQLRDVMARNGITSTRASAEVTRHDGGIRVALRPGCELPNRVAGSAAVRAAAALRAFDPRSTSVDVVLED